MLDFHKYSQRPIQISKVAKHQKEGAGSGAKTALSSADFVLSFKMNLREDPVSARKEGIHDQDVFGIPPRDEL